LTEIKIVINEAQLEMHGKFTDIEVCKCVEIMKALNEVGISEPSAWAFCSPEIFYKKLKTIFCKMIREDFVGERKEVFWFYQEDENEN